jgi:hypothetical protein
MAIELVKPGTTFVANGEVKNRMETDNVNTTSLRSVTVELSTVRAVNIALLNPHRPPLR